MRSEVSRNSRANGNAASFARDLPYVAFHPPAFSHLSLSPSLSLSLSPSLSPPLSLSLSRPFRGNSMWDAFRQRRCCRRPIRASSLARPILIFPALGLFSRGVVDRPCESSWLCSCPRVYSTLASPLRPARPRSPARRRIPVPGGGRKNCSIAWRGRARWNARSRDATEDAGERSRCIDSVAEFREFRIPGGPRQRTRAWANWILTGPEVARESRHRDNRVQLQSGDLAIAPIIVEGVTIEWNNPLRCLDIRNCTVPEIKPVTVKWIAAIFASMRCDINHTCVIRESPRSVYNANLGRCSWIALRSYYNPFALRIGYEELAKISMHSYRCPNRSIRSRKYDERERNDVTRDYDDTCIWISRDIEPEILVLSGIVFVHRILETAEDVRDTQIFIYGISWLDFARCKPVLLRDACMQRNYFLSARRFIESILLNWIMNWNRHVDYSVASRINYGISNRSKTGRLSVLGEQKFVPIIRGYSRRSLLTWACYWRNLPTTGGSHLRIDGEHFNVFTDDNVNQADILVEIPMNENATSTKDFSWNFFVKALVFQINSLNTYLRSFR